MTPVRHVTLSFDYERIGGITGRMKNAREGVLTSGLMRSDLIPIECLATAEAEPTERQTEPPDGEPPQTERPDGEPPKIEVATCRFWERCLEA